MSCLFDIRCPCMALTECGHWHSFHTYSVQKLFVPSPHYDSPVPMSSILPLFSDLLPAIPRCACREWLPQVLCSQQATARV